MAVDLDSDPPIAGIPADRALGRVGKQRGPVTARVAKRWEYCRARQASTWADQKKKVEPNWLNQE
jgi:hypothetical protein